MRTTICLSLPVETVTALRTHAAKVGKPMSTVINELVLAHLPATEGATPAPAPRVRAEMNRREAACWGAFQRLIVKHEELEPSDLAYRNRIFSLREIAREAGLYPSEARSGLRGLEARGLLKTMMAKEVAALKVAPELAPEVEHWLQPPTARR